MNFNLYEFHEGIKKDNIMFCYSGPISQATVEGIGKTLRLNMELNDAGFTTSQSVFSIFVEQMQNILNYSAEKINQNGLSDKELRAGVLVIGQEESGFCVYCGNRVYNCDVKTLQEKVDFLRMLDKNELKTLYKEKRKQVSDSDSKGAGLGLIEMARKAGKPIEYTLYTINDVYSFFSIKVMVGR